MRRKADYSPSVAKRMGLLAQLASMPITVDGQTVVRAWSETVSLARAHGLSTYDEACLELSIRESLALASLDDKLKLTAKAVGVPSYVP